MSLAIPAFADLTKATKTVLYGDVAGDGAFAPGVTQVGPAAVRQQQQQQQRTLSIAAPQLTGSCKCPSHIDLIESVYAL
jgi:hypothetical protein